MYLLERERNFLQRHEEFIEQKRKLQAILNAALDKDIDLREIESMLGPTTQTSKSKPPAEEAKQEEAKTQVSQVEEDEDEDSKFGISAFFNKSFELTESSRCKLQKRV